MSILFVLFLLGTNLVFEDEITALQHQVDKLTTLNVNKIVALGHSGFEMDKLIAQKVKGVDVVVGGHSNTFLYTGNCFQTIIPSRMSTSLSHFCLCNCYYYFYNYLTYYTNYIICNTLYTCSTH